MSDAVLPSLLVLLVEGELGDDVLVDTGEGQSLFRAFPDGHGDQSHVGVRRLLRRFHLLRTRLLERRVLRELFFFLHRVRVVDYQSHCVIVQAMVRCHHLKNTSKQHIKTKPGLAIRLRNGDEALFGEP